MPNTEVAGRRLISRIVWSSLLSTVFLSLAISERRESFKKTPEACDILENVLWNHCSPVKCRRTIRRPFSALTKGRYNSHSFYGYLSTYLSQSPWGPDLGNWAVVTNMVKTISQMAKNLDYFWQTSAWQWRSRVCHSILIMDDRLRLASTYPRHNTNTYKHKPVPYARPVHTHLSPCHSFDFGVLSSRGSFISNTAGNVTTWLFITETRIAHHHLPKIFASPKWIFKMS